MTALAFLLLSAGGTLIGCATGLLPSLHVNTLSVVLVALAPTLQPVGAALGLGPETQAFAVPALLLSIVTAHTFVQIIPATYLGAPDESTALSVLPAHRLLMQGQGFRAVALAAYAGFAGIAAALALLGPLHWLLTGPWNLWDPVRKATPWLLLALIAFLVLREPRRLGPETWPPRVRHAMGVLSGLSLFLAAGVYGLTALDLSYDAWLPVASSPLLPMLGGLYGAATMIEAFAQGPRVPHQFLKLHGQPLPLRRAVGALGVGVGAGIMMSLWPALTNASATAVVGATRRSNDEDALVSLGSVGAANGVFNLLMLWTFDRARSGAVVAVQQVLRIDPWVGPVPASLTWMLFVGLASAVLGLLATLALGRWAARRIHLVPYRRLVAGVLVYATVIVALFSGPTGIIVYVVGAALGYIPVRLGLQRTHLTGVLLIPVLSFFLT